jgi:hypothetical protein
VAAGGVISAVAELPDAAVAPLFDAVDGSPDEVAPPFSGSAAAVVVAGDSTGLASGLLASAVPGGVADVVAEPPSVVAAEVDDAVAERSEVAGDSEAEAAPSAFCGAVAVCCPLASPGVVRDAVRSVAAGDVACAIAEPPSKWQAGSGCCGRAA